MIPILYGSKESTFTSNGLYRLRDCLTCVVVEERNSVYECDFSYPVDGWKFDEIRCGRIIGVTHDDTGDIQPFEIVSYTRPIDGIVEFHAVHVSYRLRGMTKAGTGINSLSQAFQFLTTNPFTFEAKFSANGFMASADGTPRSLRQYLGGVEGSVLDAYGGEYEWDKFNVILHRKRGVDRDFAIRYGVNMLDYQEELDYGSSFTACIPFWTGQDNSGAPVKVVASKVTSGNPSYNNHEICVPLDLTEKFETKPTKTQLRTMALSYMATHQTHLPAQNIEVDFVRLSELGEYDAFEGLLSYRLCDTIKVIFPMYGMEGRFKIVKTEWDVLGGSYVSMELGTLSTSLSEALGIGQETPSERQVIPALNEGETTRSVASGTSFTDTGIALSLSAGLYMLIGTAGFSGNSTGVRALRWYVGSSDTGWTESAESQSASGTFTSRLQVTRLVRLDQTTTIRLQTFQNSGSALSTSFTYSYIRIGG